ncbi:diaminopimelate epimerase [Natronincola peptidivorans]|uniref:Diaminopimelate epimerase n=1 Tax=Natronincola peptidivorans TaxID=426128 RepID=A0A1H9YA88_9FIRM|nr:diaminopimelate epimerase [Natronincola peptidivorans]SES65876.1 diaminopimelate epimerase [Natronincola peptidivorans]
MNIPFKKLHGAGNDFIIIKYDSYPYEKKFNDLAVKSCHRRFGIGADGLMIVAASKEADFKMYYYNSDGSRANMCGNGIRCFAKFVYDEGLVKAKNFTIETLAGIKTVEILEKNGSVYAVSVNMGKMTLEPKKIPVKAEGAKDFINRTIKIEDKEFLVSTVLMGVPHTVIFTDELDMNIVKKFGPIIEKHGFFPEGTNVNFAKIVDEAHIEVRTWERGAGYTLACGTGVTSVCGVAHLLNLAGDTLLVSTEGGTLKITVMENQLMIMEGPAEDICYGVYVFNNIL